MRTLAIFSPNHNAYSETFIQAHRKLPYQIKFYFNGWLPSSLEGKSMMQLPWKLRIKKKLLKGFLPNEKKLMFSLIHEKVDGVLAEYGQSAVHTLKVIKHLNLPLVVHFHGFDASVYDIVKQYTEPYREVFGYAHGVIAVSQRMKSDLVALGCNEKKIVVTPCAPNDQFFELNPQYKSRQFISIGRFVEKKAPYITILAIQKVAKVFPDAALVMIGDGTLKPVCENIVNALGLQDNITFAGVQSSEQIQRILESSIAFVQHSIIAADGDSEGTPVAVLEAQAAALPVIATKHAGIPDVVIHNQTGLLCEEKDVNAMAENMIRLLSEPGLAGQLGKAGRERVRENFTMEKHLGKLKEVIDEALARS